MYPAQMQTAAGKGADSREESAETEHKLQEGGLREGMDSAHFAKCQLLASHGRWKRMIRLGNHIRLTRRDIERFTEITGFVPKNVKTLDALDAYVQRCKRHYKGQSEDASFLRWLIDQERLRCMGIPSPADLWRC